MSLTRTATRVVATLAASAALTVGAASAASAATVSNTVDGNSVSVTFKVGLTDLTTPVDGCVAVVAERGQADGVIDHIKNLVDLDNISDVLSGERTTVLRTDTGSPVALPVLTRPVTLSADGIADGVHSLVTYCATDTVPVMRTIVVGDAQNSMGSIVSEGPALISSGMNFF
ncbi:hypothetical protein [uncultured Dietzia sp.]|uniref:hypothetical protein n=1 Tax=uncultured Dietzia sp. TaxID=395519 RepID=UPI0025F45AB7|nr:hypothetical protein [uncultured Dietzia sp.]